MKNDNHDADVAFIKALAELLHENDLTEVHVKRDYGEDDSLNVRVSRGRPASVISAPAMPLHPAPVAHIPHAPGPVAAPQAESDDPAGLPGAVTSPMVGTVYLQPEPGTEPFVKIGDTVTEGQTLLIIEAMKTMNHIPSPRAGTVRRILVEDGSPVEFGSALLIVE